MPLSRQHDLQLLGGLVFQSPTTRRRERLGATHSRLVWRGTHLQAALRARRRHLSRSLLEKKKRSEMMVLSQAQCISYGQTFTTPELLIKVPVGCPAHEVIMD